MTSKIVVNNIEADAGISTVTFNNEVTAPTFNGNIVGTAATFSGNVDIAGALTYEDVTNVDSVGVVTARSGIHVTGGSVGIGQTNPQGDLHIGNINGSKNLIMHSANQGNARIRFREGGSIASGFNEYSIGMVGLNNALTVEGQGAGEIIRIMGDTGLVGIGTDAPANKLSISDPGYTGIELQSDRTTATDNIGGLHFRTLSTNVAYIQSLVDGTVRIRNTSSLTERFRITSDGKIGVNNNAPLYAMHFKNAMSSSPSFVHMEVTGSNAVGGGGGIAFDTSASNALSNNGLYLATISGVRNSADDGSNDLVFKTSKSGVAGDDGNTHSPKERLRITSDGKVGVGAENPQATLQIGAGFDSGNPQRHGTLLISADNSLHNYIRFTNGGGTESHYPAGIWYQPAGRMELRAASSASASNEAQLVLASNGVVGINTTTGFDTSVGLAVRNGASGSDHTMLDIIANTNETSRLVFSDDSDHNQGRIQYNHNGNSLAFYTNGNNERLRIGSSGRVCISPTAHFGSESTNMALSIVNNGGTGGYPAIHLGSVSTGGNTNGANGMSLVATDANWNLQTSSGGVHGLGILTGNSSNSANVAMYIRSDKKTITGPSAYAELDTATSSGTAFCVAGGGLSVGPLGNGGDTVQGGRYVLGWYMYRYNGANTYAHLTTSLYGGSGSNTEYIMGGFHIHGLKYSSSGISEEIIYFHNWSGSLAGYTRNHYGNWDPNNYVYVGTGGYVTLRLSNGQYYGYIIDLIQHAWYANRDITVTNVTYSNSGTI